MKIREATTLGDDAATTIIINQVGNGIPKLTIVSPEFVGRNYYVPANSTAITKLENIITLRDMCNKVIEYNKQHQDSN